MEDILMKKLKDDETLLWSAKPEAFVTLDKTHKSRFIAKAIAIGVALIALMVLYIVAANKNNAPVQIPVILILLAAGAYGAFGEFLEANKLRSKTIYALTDQRMIAIMGMSVETVEYGRMTEGDYEFVTDEDGHTSLLCGERAREVKPHGRRTATVCGAQNNAETGQCHGFAMYGITEEVKAIESIISVRMGIAQ